MKREHLSKLIPLVLFTILFIPTSSVAHGETSTIATVPNPVKKINYREPFIETYDKSGKLIKSYSKMEIKQLKQQILAPNLYEEPKPSDEKPYVHYYDRNGIMIDSSDKKLLQSQREAVKKVEAAGLSVYNYEETSFSNHVWVGDERSFSRPKNIVIDAKKEFSSMTVQIFQEHSQVGSVKIGNFSGEVNVPIENFTSYSGEYKIKFITEKPHGYDIYLHGGQVYYK